MLWVGLTGGIASGKSTVAEILKRMGIEVVSADHLSHLAMGPNTTGAKQIREQFGSEVFDEGDIVNRMRLGAVVFSDTTGRKKELLENILHPEVRRLAQIERERLTNRGDQVAFYEIPLLFEKNLKSQFDRVLCIAVDPSLQIQRLMERANLTEHEAKARIQAQLPQETKIKGADFVIWNRGNIADLKKEAKAVLDQLMRP